jgi:hypothetical protein
MLSDTGWRADRATGRWSWGVLVVGLALGAGGLAIAQRPGRPQAPPADQTPGSGLWISAAPLEDGRQLLMVVDPAVRTAAVYHVEATTGAIALKSTRNLTWDLLVGEFNTGEPRPAAVRRMVEQDSTPR